MPKVDVEPKLPDLISTIAGGAKTSHNLASWAYGKVGRIDLGDEGGIEDVYVEKGKGIGVRIEWTEVDLYGIATRRISKANRGLTGLSVVEQRPSGKEVGYIVGEGNMDSALIVSPFVDHPGMTPDRSVGVETQRRVRRQLAAIAAVIK